MKKYFTSFTLLLVIAVSFSSCEKEQYFQSEKSIQKKLQGTWDLVAIPLLLNDTLYHVENWVFSDSKVTITNNGQTGSSTFSVNTTWTKAEFKLDGVSAPLSPDFYNGTWQIITLDDDLLKIANDDDGASGISELEFTKRK